MATAPKVEGTKPKLSEAPHSRLAGADEEMAPYLAFAKNDQHKQDMLNTLHTIYRNKKNHPYDYKEKRPHVKFDVEEHGPWYQGFWDLADTMNLDQLAAMQREIKNASTSKMTPMKTGALDDNGAWRHRRLQQIRQIINDVKDASDQQKHEMFILIGSMAGFYEENPDAHLSSSSMPTVKNSHNRESLEKLFNMIQSVDHKKFVAMWKSINEELTNKETVSM